MTASEVTVTPTTYTVSLLPESNCNHHSYALTVQYRGDDRWAVLHVGYCLGSDGEWDYESIPSERRDDWLATHRFPFDEAVRLAVKAAPKVDVNGWTAERVLAEGRGAR